MTSSFPLSELKPGISASITAVAPLNNSTEELAIVKRLLELGIVEGTSVKVQYEAPISRDPIAISVRGGLVAIRKSDARRVLVKREGV